MINRDINTRIIVTRYLIAIFPRVKLKSLPLLLSLFLLFLIGREILSVPSPRRKRFHGCLYFFQHYVHVVGLPVLAGRFIKRDNLWWKQREAYLKASEGGRSNLRPPRKWSVLKRAERVGQFMTRN